MVEMIMKNILDEKRMVIFNVDLMQGGIILIRWVMSLVEVMIEYNAQSARFLNRISYV